MKSINFQLRVNFSSDVTTDEEIKEVMENIVKGLKTQCYNEGLAPNDSEAFTKGVQIFEPGSGLIIEEFFIVG